MAYIGNTLRTAQPNYQIIDDISASFDGSTTTFALQVGGVTPVPFPVSAQHCLISVGGVVQQPDPTGTDGFLLSGSNIVFSAAPSAGENFFGVVLAGADYINVGANFPDGSVATPSITFDQDTDTGLYRKGANNIAITTNGTERVSVGTSEVVFNDGGNDINFRIEGDTNSSLFFVDAGNDRVGIGTTSNLSGLLTLHQNGDQLFLKQTDGDSGFLIGSNNTNGDLVFKRRAVGSNSERARLTADGKLLVGTSSSSSSSIAVFQGFAGDSTGPGIAYFQRGQTAPTTNAEIGQIFFANSSGNIGSGISAIADASWTAGSSHPGRLVFSTTASGNSSPTERMRIVSGGDVLIGTTILYGTGVTLRQNATSQFKTTITGTTSAFVVATGTYNPAMVVRGNGGIANYQVNNVNLSDRNSKKDIVPTADTWGCIKEWEIVNYRYKDQPAESDLHVGVIAQQVAESCPEVITIFEEAKDDQPEKLGVREQQMYWMAIKALQEAQVRIETLEAKVAALETRLTALEGGAS